MGSYSVRLKRSAATEIEALPRKDRARIIERIRTLSDDPRPAGSAKLSGRDAHRIRQGDYRIVYTVDDEDRVVMVSVVAHRRDAYRCAPAAGASPRPSASTSRAGAPTSRPPRRPPSGSRPR